MAHLMMLALSRVVEVELLGTSKVHDDIEEQELTSSQGTDHNATGAKTNSAQLDEANLVGDAAQAGHDGTVTTSTSLVDLGEQGISRVGDDSGGNTGNDTGEEGDTQLGTTLQLGQLLAHGSGDGLSGGTLDSELGHGVWDLLHQDRTEARVETLDEALLLQQSGGSREKTVGEAGVGDQADTSGLKRAQEDIGDELSSSRGAKVDTSAVIPSGLLTDGLGNVDLEELHTAELEPTLDEVTDDGRTKTSGQTGSTLLSDDGLESTNQTLVILDRVQLDSGLDDVNWAAAENKVRNLFGSRDSNKKELT